jgi:hypothetical protein
MTYATDEFLMYVYLPDVNVFVLDNTDAIAFAVAHNIPVSSKNWSTIFDACHDRKICDCNYDDFIG